MAGFLLVYSFYRGQNALSEALSRVALYSLLAVLVFGLFTGMLGLLQSEGSTQSFTRARLVALATVLTLLVISAPTVGPRLLDTVGEAMPVAIIVGATVAFLPLIRRASLRKMPRGDIIALSLGAWVLVVWVLTVGTGSNGLVASILVVGLFKLRHAHICLPIAAAAAFFGCFYFARVSDPSYPGWLVFSGSGQVEVAGWAAAASACMLALSLSAVVESSSLWRGRVRQIVVIQQILLLLGFIFAVSHIDYIHSGFPNPWGLVAAAAALLSFRRPKRHVAATLQLCATSVVVTLAENVEALEIVVLVGISIATALFVRVWGHRELAAQIRQIRSTLADIFIGTSLIFVAYTIAFSVIDTISFFQFGRSTFGVDLGWIPLGQHFVEAAWPLADGLLAGLSLLFALAAAVLLACVLWDSIVSAFLSYRERRVGIYRSPSALATIFLAMALTSQFGNAYYYGVLRASLWEHVGFILLAGILALLAKVLHRWFPLRGSQSAMIVVVVYLLIQSSATGVLFATALWVFGGPWEFGSRVLLRPSTVSVARATAIGALALGVYAVTDSYAAFLNRLSNGVPFVVALTIIVAILGDSPTRHVPLSEVLRRGLSLNRLFIRIAAGLGLLAATASSVDIYVSSVIFGDGDLVVGESAEATILTAAFFVLWVLVGALTFGGMAYVWGQLGLFLLVQHRREARLPAHIESLELLVQGVRALEEVYSKHKQSGLAGSRTSD
jgi:hypothetical protein